MSHRAELQIPVGVEVMFLTNRCSASSWTRVQISSLLLHCSLSVFLFSFEASSSRGVACKASWK